MHFQSNNDAKGVTLFIRIDGSMYVLMDKGSKGTNNGKGGSGLVHPCLISRMGMGTYRQQTRCLEHIVVSIV